jgi:hypothetical protein
MDGVVLDTAPSFGPRQTLVHCSLVAPPPPFFGFSAACYVKDDRMFSKGS